MLEKSKSSDTRARSSCLQTVITWFARKRLHDDGMSLVSGGSEQRSQCGREILVQFEFHAAGVSTIRSRASSAAYVIAAAT